MEKLRGDFLNTSLSCYFDRTSQDFVRSQIHLQAMSVVLSVALLALYRLKTTERVPFLFSAAIGVVSIACLFLTNISNGLLHEDINRILGQPGVDKKALVNLLGHHAARNFKLIYFINRLPLVFIAMLFFMVMQRFSSWMSAPIVIGAGYNLLKIDVSTLEFKQRLLEALNECK